MIEPVSHRRRLVATLILNTEDSFLRARLGPRAHPRPYEPLRFWLVGKVAPEPSEAFGPPREMVITRNPSGYHLFFGEEWLSNDVAARGSRAMGREGGQRARRRMALTPGTYLVRVTSPLYQDEQRPVVLPVPNLNLRDSGSPDPALRDPLAPYTFMLRPSYAYPFPDRYPVRVDDPDECPEAMPGRLGPTLLFGGLYTPEGRGLEGASVQVPTLTERYRIGADGQWVLWFPEPPRNGNDPLLLGPPTVRFTLPGPAAVDVDVPGVCVVRGCTTSLNQTALRGWVLQQGIGVSGATVAVAGQESTVRTDAQGGWRYYFDLNQPTSNTVVSISVTLPDGSSRSRDNIGVRRRATVTVPSFTFP